MKTLTLSLHEFKVQITHLPSRRAFLEHVRKKHVDGRRVTGRDSIAMCCTIPEEHAHRGDGVRAELIFYKGADSPGSIAHEILHGLFYRHGDVEAPVTREFEETMCHYLGEILDATIGWMADPEFQGRTYGHWVGDIRHSDDETNP